MLTDTQNEWVENCVLNSHYYLYISIFHQFFCNLEVNFVKKMEEFGDSSCDSADGQSIHIAFDMLRYLNNIDNARTLSAMANIKRTEENICKVSKKNCTFSLLLPF